MYEVPGFKLGVLTAASDLSALQYCFAKVSAAGVVDAALAADKSVGIIQNKPKADIAVELMCDGVSKVMAGGVINAGDVVGPDATSRAVSSPTVPAGVALESAAAAGVVIAVLVNIGTSNASVAATKLASSENSYIKTDVGVKDLLLAAAATRIVNIVVTVTTVFANGDGAQPTLTIGEESGSATKFAAAAKFTNAAAGATFAFAGTLTSGKKLQATLVAGTGTTETGAYTIDVIAVG